MAPLDRRTLRPKYKEITAEGWALNKKGTHYQTPGWAVGEEQATLMMFRPRLKVYPKGLSYGASHPYLIEV